MGLILGTHASRRTPDLGRWPSRFGALFITGLLVAACQGGSGATSAVAPTHTAGPTNAIAFPSPSASAPAASPTGTTIVASPSTPRAIDPRADGLDVAFGEFAITLEAAAIRPGPVTLVVHNAGKMTHGFEMKIEGGGSGRDRQKIETRTFHSGETLRVEADLKPGVYEIECFVDGHASKGMRTTLKVRANAPLITPTAGSPAPGIARIVQFAFVPASLEVAAGTRVTWINDDPTPHTVTAGGGAFDSRQLDPGASFAVVLQTPGTYDFHCEIHPTMVGSVVVH